LNYFLPIVNHKNLVKTSVIMGVTLFYFWVSMLPVFSYSQYNTHPALTNAAIDFYNLSFSENKLTDDDKKNLIEGAIREDDAPLSVNHFYDPVYNEGWLGYTTSKEWGLYSEVRQATTNLALAQYKLPTSFIDSTSYADWSYERAIWDYARGDRKRAMIGMGHLLHLLEDSAVPEHTRGDTHLPWHHATSSPYEKETDKWKINIWNISENLFNEGENPILLSSQEKYFDEIAKYSNGYFFSEDTIFSDKYYSPNLNSTKFFLIKNENKLFAINYDKNGREYKLALLNTFSLRNFTDVNEVTLEDPDIGSIILDGYWERLSNEFVLNGAGALKLFLEQGEEAKKLYIEKYGESNDEDGLWDKFLGFFGFGNENNTNIDFQIIGGVLNNDNIVYIEQNIKDDANNDNDDAILNNDDAISSPSPSPLLNDDIILQNDDSVPSNYCDDELENRSFINGEVVAVQDGDTFQIHSGRFIRLIGVDSPEKNDDYYEDAKKALSEMIMGNEVLIEAGLDDTDNFGRMLGYVFVNNKFVNLDMIKNGWASATPVKPNTACARLFKDSEDDAKIDRMGMWVVPAKRVVINEIAWAGTGASPYDEWIELYNAEGEDVDLSGWRLESDDLSPAIEFPEGTIIGAGKYFLIERFNDDVVSNIDADLAVSFGHGGLNNNGEVIALYNDFGVVADMVGEKDKMWYSGNSGDRVSMERIDPLVSGKDYSNWKNFTGLSFNGEDSDGGEIKGTPKRVNSKVISRGSADFMLASLGSLLGIGGDFEGGLNEPEMLSDGVVYNDLSSKIIGIALFFEPAVLPDGIIVSVRFSDSSYGVVAINGDGVEKWRYKSTYGRTANLIVLDDGSVMFRHPAGGPITKLDVNGNKIWDSDIGGKTSDLALDDDGNVFFTIVSLDKMVKLSPNGDTLWISTDGSRFGGFNPAPVDGGDVFVSADMNGLPGFYRFNGDTGELLWSDRVKIASLYKAINLTYDKEENMLYASTRSTRIIRIKVLTNEMSEYMTSCNEGVIATVPTKVREDSLLIGMFNVFDVNRKAAICSIEKGNEDGKIFLDTNWEAELSGEVLNKIETDLYGNIFFTTKDGVVESLDSEGNTRWSLDLGSSVSGHLAIGDSVVYVSIDGKLFEISE